MGGMESFAWNDKIFPKGLKPENFGGGVKFDVYLLALSLKTYGSPVGGK